MAYGRRYSRRKYGKRRSTKRKAYSRKSGRGNSTRRLASSALRAVKKITKRMKKELQLWPVNQANYEIDGTSSMYYQILNRTERGDEEYERIGDDLEASGFKIRATFGLSPATVDSTRGDAWFRRCRMMVVNMKSALAGGSQTPAWDTILDPRNSVTLGVFTNWSIFQADLCRYTKEQQNNIDVLYDRIVRIDVDTPQVNISHWIPFKKTIHYRDFSGGSDYQFDNQVYICFMPLDGTHSGAEGRMVVNYQSDFRFYE